MPADMSSEDQKRIRRAAKALDRIRKIVSQILQLKEELKESFRRQALEFRRGDDVEGSIVELLETYQADDAQLATFLGDLHDTLVLFRKPFETLLEGLKDKSFRSLAANQRIASLLQEIANRLGVAFECSRPDCRLPSKLRCRPAAKKPAGVFQFEHPGQSGRMTSHGGHSELPLLKIIDAAPDRRKKAHPPVENIS